MKFMISLNKIDYSIILLFLRDVVLLDEAAEDRIVLGVVCDQSDNLSECDCFDLVRVHYHEQVRQDFIRLFTQLLNHRNELVLV